MVLEEAKVGKEVQGSLKVNGEAKPWRRKAFMGEPSRAFGGMDYSVTA